MLCRGSTVPAEMTQTNDAYGRAGYRVIGVGHKQIRDMDIDAIMNMPRQHIESGLDFLGLIMLENKLKPQTTPVIGQLHAANIRTLMATGDNLMTV